MNVRTPKRLEGRRKRRREVGNTGGGSTMKSLIAAGGAMASVSLLIYLVFRTSLPGESAVGTCVLLLASIAVGIAGMYAVARFFRFGWPR
jgi:hypothetical protein